MFVKKSSYEKLKDEYEILKNFVDELFIVFELIKRNEEFKKEDEENARMAKLMRLAIVRYERDPALNSALSDIDSVPTRLENLKAIAINNYLGLCGLSEIIKELRIRANNVLNDKEGQTNECV